MKEPRLEWRKKSQALGRISIFPKGHESFQLAIPFLGIFLAVWEIFFQPDWQPSHQAWMRFFSNIVFFNSLHVVLTFVLVLKMSSLKKWVQDRYQVSPRVWLLRMVGVGLGFFLVFAVGGAYYVVEEVWRKPFVTVLLLLSVSAPHFHSLWQIRGLSLLYEQKWRQIFQPSQNLSQQIQQSLHRERTLLNVFFVSYVLLQLTHLLIRAPADLQVHKEMVSFSVHPSFLTTLREVFAGGNALLALLILINASLSPSVSYTNRSLFLIRLVLYPLSGYSLLAFASLSALHGLEYFSVFWKISNRAEASEKVRVRVWGVGAMLGLLPFFLPQLFVIWGFLEFRSYFQFLAAFGMATVYTHYLADRQLYRMRDPVTRKTVGSLLMS